MGVARLSPEQIFILLLSEVMIDDVTGDILVDDVLASILRAG